MNDNTNKKTKHTDHKLNLLLAQTGIAVITLIIVLIIKLIGGDIYSYSKQVFIENFDKPINIEQVLNAQQARKVVAAQATVYGIGGETDDPSIPFFESYDEITDEVSNEITQSNVNSMCLPVVGRVTCEFGYRIHPVTGKESMHKGIDIGADMGEDIVCVLDGEVLKTVNNDANYGNYVVIKHSDSVSTMYAHCSKLSVKQGQKVKKGEKIALAGSTGLSTGPHLHFEVRVNDIRLNPRWFLKL
ncbi:MAG: M23 family metallopeptidase [Clostridia bacterium]|nr:M23 family metallopeptidase [Clostridia bacterium]